MAYVNSGNSSQALLLIQASKTTVRQSRPGQAAVGRLRRLGNKFHLAGPRPNGETKNYSLPAQRLVGGQLGLVLVGWSLVLGLLSCQPRIALSPGPWIYDQGHWISVSPARYAHLCQQEQAQRQQWQQPSHQPYRPVSLTVLRQRPWDFWRQRIVLSLPEPLFQEHGAWLQARYAGLVLLALKSGQQPVAAYIAQHYGSDAVYPLPPAIRDRCPVVGRKVEIKAIVLRIEPAIGRPRFHQPQTLIYLLVTGISS